MTPGENTRMKEKKTEEGDEKKKSSCTHQYKRNQKERKTPLFYDFVVYRSDFCQFVCIVM